MVEKGWRLGDDLEYLEVEGGDRSEAAWASRFEAVLRYLFPPFPSGARQPPAKPRLLTALVR
jgi:hypothetical protein